MQGVGMDIMFNTMSQLKTKQKLILTKIQLHENVKTKYNE